MEAIKTIRVKTEQGKFEIRVVVGPAQSLYAEYRKLDTASNFWIRVGSPLRPSAAGDAQAVIRLIGECTQSIASQFGHVEEIDPDWTAIRGAA